MGRGSLESGDKVAPAENAFVIEPSDSADLESPTRGVYVGSVGDLRVRMVGGNVLKFVGLGEGIIHPLRIIRIYATGTTATDIIGLR